MTPSPTTPVASRSHRRHRSTAVPHACLWVSCAVVAISWQAAAHADVFGSGTNSFTIPFVTIGNTSNAADTNGYGAVPYEYRVSTYEISQSDIDRATASGASGLTGSPAPAWTGNQPTTNATWYRAAAFANWLNTSSGYQPAYNLTDQTTGYWSMALWDPADAWTAGGTNLYRNKNAIYFLPNENEWYKSAYYNPAGSNYFLYPTASNTAPTAVTGGTSAGTAVYNNAASAPAGVANSGGLSPYGVMGLGGNAREWVETAFDGVNNSPTEPRAMRGGGYTSSQTWLASSFRFDDQPSQAYADLGFRVAAVAVPEPSTWVIGACGIACGAWTTLRRRNRA